MQELRVVGVEDGSLVVTSDEGAQYRIAIDDDLRSNIRQVAPDAGTGRRLSPKDIQAHIRSGMSAEDVASITGASLEYIQRFEGPVVAERQYVVESALAVPVHTARDTELSDQPTTFGTAILNRLHDAGATGERWASWKEEGTGWIVKLSFTADAIDHDARWRFDPKKSALAPLNTEAENLSRQGDSSDGLIPRLRAVDGHDRVADSSRFDSGAFIETEPHPADDSAGAPRLEAVPHGKAANQGGDSASDAAPTNQTSDLLEALRRRRGERESAQYDETQEARNDHPSTGSIRLVDVALPEMEDDQPLSIQHRAPKKGRTAMPSWDEIVFGARSDDDPA